MSKNHTTFKEGLSAQAVKEGFYLSEEGEWIPDGWEKKKLGDLVEITSSKRVFHSDYTDTGVPFYRSKEIIEKSKGNHISQKLFITEKKFQEFENKHGTPKYGDMLLTSVGTLGIPYVVKDEKFYFKDGNLTWFRKFSGITSEYLKTWFTSGKGIEQINQITIGSTQSALTITGLKGMDITLPPLPEQKAIAAVLGSLDDKIELLREQNETLETLAQTLFKRWFIDFNFPDKNGKPYKDNGGTMIPSELGEIPERWVQAELGDIVTVKRGGSPRPIKEFITEGEGLRWLKISDASATNSPYIHNIKEKIIFEGLKKTTHLDAGKLVLSNSATPGIPKFVAVDTCIHDGWLHFPEIGYLTQEYLYLLFLKIRPQLLQQGNGSVFKNLKTDILKQHVISIPNVGSEYEYLLKAFNRTFEKIGSNTQQIQNLTNLRDTLSPKLMKGVIRIKKEEF